jgi:pimeloyl-ACP methyl ester carboxylesterase
MSLRIVTMRRSPRSSKQRWSRYPEPPDVGALRERGTHRGGRPDLAGTALSKVTAPTLLIVGALDEPVIELNEQARALMRSARVKLTIVPHATHLFEEPGTLDEVERLSGKWFTRYLRTA